MRITSAEFKKGITGDDEILWDGLPQVAFIGRSNVGKSSTINSLTGKKNLANVSTTPGRTQQINFFLINKTFYLVDLPGYGYAKGSWEKRDALTKLIHWYLLESEATPKKVVLILDAKVGPTANDLTMLGLLANQDANVLIIANKIDAVKKSELKKNLAAIEGSVQGYPVIPYSAKEHIGTAALI